jgi:hypothetical protein
VDRQDAREDLGDAGTLHLLPADELPAFVGAQRAIPPRHHQPAWLRHHGLTRAQADAMLAAIPDALSDGELTRDELAATVERLSGERGRAAARRRGAARGVRG